jgi:kynureninase
MIDGPLTEQMLRALVFPMYSRALDRPDHPELGRPPIYLANHSLGRAPDRMALDVVEALNLWYRDIGGAWDTWLAEIERFRSNVATLIGWERPDAIVPKTSAGQGLRAVLNAMESRTPRVLATRGEFDSIDFILRVYHERGRADVRWVEAAGEDLFDAASIIERIDGTIDLVVLPHVFFVTGQVLEGLDDIIRAAHAHGAMVMIDSYHSAGVLPLEYGALGPDFVIGGSYKYLRGGPGACWLAVHPRFLDGGGRAGELVPLDTGWFAKRDVFAYERPDPPVFAEGGDAWLESTPPILTAYQAKAGLQILLEIGVDRLREYNLQQQAVLSEALRSNGVAPRLIEPRGAFLLVEDPDATSACKALAARGVETDARWNYIRFGPDMLNTEAELMVAAKIAGAVLTSRAAAGG